MKKIILLTLLLGNYAQAVGYLQNSDFATCAAIIAAGGTQAQCLNSSKLYDSANSQLLDVTIAGKISGPLTGDVTTVGSAATIANSAVTNAKMANMTQSTIKGRAVGAGTGAPTDLTATQATAILDVFNGDAGAGGLKGLVPAPAAGDSLGKFLKADGTWNSVYSTYALPANNIDWRLASVFTKTLGANTTFTFSNVTPGQNISVRISNPTNYTVTWPTTKWASGSVPTASSTADMCTFIHDGVSFYGNCVQDMH